VAFLEQVADALAADMVGNRENLFNQVVFTLIRDYPGGLESLLERFTAAGFGEHVRSWLGDGPNLPLATDDLARVFDREQVAGMAAKLGLTPDAAAAGLARAIPDIVNRLTPGNHVDAAFVKESLDLLTGRVL
jgi:uncharacterized protein YidB (DUF937 family)